VNELVRLLAVVNCLARPPRLPGCNGPEPECDGFVSAAMLVRITTIYATSAARRAAITACVLMLYDNTYSVAELLALGEEGLLIARQATTLPCDDHLAKTGGTRLELTIDEVNAKYRPDAALIVAEQHCAPHSPEWFEYRSQRRFMMLATASMLHALLYVDGSIVCANNNTATVQESDLQCCALSAIAPTTALPRHVRMGVALGQSVSRKSVFAQFDDDSRNSP
jgi:hypothetical protein